MTPYLPELSAVSGALDYTVHKAASGIKGGGRNIYSLKDLLPQLKDLCLSSQQKKKNTSFSLHTFSVELLSPHLLL